MSTINPIEKTMLNWPALRCLSLNQIDNEIGSKIDRGIIGKADRVQVDFRILARSKIFSSSLESIYLGTENKVVNTLAWLNNENKLKAIHLYPSRAKDAANRSGSLEKHILEVPLEDFKICPFILYQQALLNRVKPYTDDLWWKIRDKQEWHNNNYFLEIDQDSKINKNEIEIALKQLNKNILNIKQYINKDKLISFYKDILSGTNFTTPMFIQGNELTADILLTLFLPLEESNIKHLSFVMKLPQGRFNHDKLSSIWDIIPNIGTDNFDIYKENHGDFQLEAENCANALFNNNPEYLENKKTDKENQSKNHNKVESLSIDNKSKALEINKGYKTNYSLISISSYSDLNFSTLEAIIKNPINSNNDIILQRLYHYLCSDNDFIEADIIFSPEELPIELNKSDDKLLYNWLEGLSKEYENKKKYPDCFRSISIKIEYIYKISLNLDRSYAKKLLESKIH